MGKPRIWDTVMKAVDAMLVKRIAWAQQCYHVQEGELVFMELGEGRKGAREEVESWSGSVWVKAL